MVELTEMVETPVKDEPFIPSEILELIDFLSLNERIIFKSQQIDDPELERSEKINIAKEIFLKNRQTFLSRFGGYMKNEQLNCFLENAIHEDTNPRKEDEHIDEMQMMLLDFQHKLKTHNRDVKNRRYTALQNLISEGEYFSEKEMIRRAPELYQELVGQYLSEEEKKERDGYDVRNTTMSGILMHTMEQQEMNNVLEIADEKADEDELDSNDTSNGFVTQSNDINNISDESDDEVPVSCRQQWGGFNDEKVECSIANKSRNKKIKLKKIKRQSKNKFITAGERDLLRQEFIGVMHQNFLSGNDTEYDYTQVDENSQLDDLQQLNQDREDEYFEGTDDESDVLHKEIKADVEYGSTIKANESDSEDELDVFMKHLT